MKRRDIALSIACSLDEEHGRNDPVKRVGVHLFGLIEVVERQSEKKCTVDS